MPLSSFAEAMVTASAARSMAFAAEERILVTKSCLAITYAELGHLEKALSMERDIYFGRLKLDGRDNQETLRAANNYALSLVRLQRFEAARSLLPKTIPVARRVLGEGHRLTLKMRWNYAQALYKDVDATLDDLREAVATLTDTERISRRVLGGAHPLTVGIEDALEVLRAAFRTP